MQLISLLTVRRTDDLLSSVDLARTLVILSLFYCDEFYVVFLRRANDNVSAHNKMVLLILICRNIADHESIYFISFYIFIAVSYFFQNFILIVCGLQFFFSFFNILALRRFDLFGLDFI